jgi:hypothetical protein
MVALLASLASVSTAALSPASVAPAPAPVAAAASAHAAAASRCATSGLVMWLNAEGAGTAGSFFYKLEFANLSGRTCTLMGYPVVSAVDLRGRRVGSSAKREVTQKPRTVTLAPLAQATAIVRVTDVGALPASCHPRTAAGFRVFAPGQTVSKVVPFPFQTCASASLSAISVRAIKHA